ncbi:MAG: sterol desaturase family protein [Proteobacteria bacterium]|nr:sterol desaturase family protein [Pseudomonadota bacterium]MBU1710771.1 sterol desaturase family protein [Pseudomonadota bacterium]
MNNETLKLILYWSGLLLFLLIELSFSYRASRYSKIRRWLANIPISIISGVMYYMLYAGLLASVFTLIETDKLGMLNNLGLSFGWRVFFGILLLDFVIYVWHLLNHEMPLLWRFHRVHHCDLYMDVSTAVRFHPGEILLSGLVRLMVIYSFGIPLFAYVLFEVLVNIAIQFHHSSIKINPAFENLWQLLFVPPSMHRIHHSVKIKERDSNYGVIFSLWDRFIGTLTTGIDQKGIVTGIGSHRKFEKLGLKDLLLMPFTKKSL